MNARKKRGRSASGNAYLEPYRAAVRQSGASFESLLWKSREYQERRFEVITHMADLAGRVVADLGCGRADLLSHMHEHGVAYERYVGVEGVPDLLRASQARAKADHLPRAEFVLADFAADEGCFDSLIGQHRADTVIFSGSLNTFEQTEAQRVLDRAWKALAPAGGTLIFNFLSTHHPPDAAPNPSPAHRFDPSRMLDWALACTRLVRLRHDYLDGHDATIAMRASV